MVIRKGSRSVRAEQVLRKPGFDLMLLPPNIVIDVAGSRSEGTYHDGRSFPETMAVLIARAGAVARD